ncbi:hypothetical protein ES705_37393 [subsurface metagenome]
MLKFKKFPEQFDSSPIILIPREADNFINYIERLSRMSEEELNEYFLKWFSKEDGMINIKGPGHHYVNIIYNEIFKKIIMEKK